MGWYSQLSMESVGQSQEQNWEAKWERGDLPFREVQAIVWGLETDISRLPYQQLQCCCPFSLSKCTLHTVKLRFLLLFFLLWEQLCSAERPDVIAAAPRPSSRSRSMCATGWSTECCLLFSFLLLSRCCLVGNPSERWHRSAAACP